MEFWRRWCVGVNDISSELVIPILENFLQCSLGCILLSSSFNNLVVLISHIKSSQTSAMSHYSNIIGCLLILSFRSDSRINVNT
jgi:hypothetical protein